MRRLDRLSRLPYIKEVIDLFLAALAAWGAFVLRLDIPLPLLYHRSIWMYVLAATLLKTLINVSFNLRRQSWRSIGVRDLLSIARAVLLFAMISSAAAFFLGGSYRIPRSIPLIDALLTLVLWGGVRLFARIFSEERVRSSGKGKMRRVLIAGAGDAGSMIAREMLRHPEARMTPVGFVDDDPAKHGLTFVGYRVFGPISSLPAVAEHLDVDEILIAIPSASGDAIRTILDMAAGLDIPARIIPGIWEVLSGRVSISHIRDVEVEDLLNRDPVKLDLDDIAQYVRDQVVMVTGAGGSIGSEIVRQLLAFSPRHLVLLGRGENSLFQMERAVMTERSFFPHTLIVADVRNRERLEKIFRRFQPKVVFHAAAHKHVPLMEQNPEEAILNNVFGTANLAELALQYQTDVFVNISTDKAVNPTSIMGASKRVAEMVVRTAALAAGPGRSFVSVRFGNVLGSRGSVIPVFKEQIRRGGPVTVTHPEMTRYFMTIPEAAQLVMQAGGMKKNGSVFVLDMGEPVRIVDLATDLIRLSGFEPGREIDVVFTGIRQGEKLFEELLTAEEGTEASHFKKIFYAKNNDLPGNFSELLEELRAVALEEDEEKIRASLQRIVPRCAFNVNGVFGCRMEERV